MVWRREGLHVLEMKATVLSSAPRCGGRLLRFGALISRLLPQVLNAWNIGRDNLAPGQERPYR